MDRLDKIDKNTSQGESQAHESKKKSYKPSRPAPKRFSNNSTQRASSSQRIESFDISSADPNDLHMIPLGGCNPDGIGMNSTVYFYKNKFIIVDLGVTFENTPGVDLVMPDMHYVENKMAQCEGIVVTHAHEDHIGSVPYLWEKLKRPRIYATPFTAGILMNKFIGLVGKNFDKSYISVIQKGGSTQLGPFNVKFISITHSVPDSNALMIKTDSGNILHTGDWKIDDTPVVGEKTDYSAFKEASKDGVLAVIGDSTNVFKEEASGSEESVGEALIEAIRNCKKGKVAVACFASNVHRIASIIEAAIECGRQPVFVGRSINLFSSVAHQFSYLSEKLEKAVVEPNDVAGLAPEKILLICTGSQGEDKAALSRMAFGKHPWFGLDKGDTVILSSRVIPGNDKQIGAVVNRLCRMGVNVQTGDINRSLHVSGHPARSELRFLYKMLKAKICVPIHGEDRHLARHAELAKELGMKSIAIHNGDVIKITESGPTKIGTVKYGRLFKDGKDLLNREGGVIMDRLKMMASGSVHISIVFNDSGDYVSVEVSSAGLRERWSRINSDIKASAINAIKTLNESGVNAQKIRDAVHTRVYQMIKSRLDKFPIISIHTHELLSS